MNVIKYFKENAKDVSFYGCGNCGKLFNDENRAEQCCKPVICSQCGKELCQDNTKNKDYVYGKDKPLCFDCWQKLLISKHEVWTQDTYEQTNKETNYKFSVVRVADEFYDDLYEAVNDLANDGLTEQEIKDTLFEVCEQTPVRRIDIESVLQNAQENMGLQDIDASIIWEDLQELLDFVAQWNKKQDYTYWTVIPKHVIPSEELIKECIEDNRID